MPLWFFSYFLFKI